MVHFLIPGISKPYLDFPVKAANEENQDYCHKLVIRLHRVSHLMICFQVMDRHLGFAFKTLVNKMLWLTFGLYFVSPPPPPPR